MLKTVNHPARLYGVPDSVKANHPKVPKFADLLFKTTSPIVAPQAVTWAQKPKAYDMDSNDQIGDCVCAAIAHLLTVWTAWSETGPELDMTPEQVTALYSAITGYIPGNPATDNGTVPDQALQYWQNTGITTSMGTKKIIGYAAVDHTNLNEVKLAIDWFGGVLFSWALPLVFQSEQNWVMPPNQQGNNAPGSWGGHETLIGEYDDDVFHTVTWGEDTTEVDSALILSPDYCTTAYVAISQDWFRKNMQTPCLMDMNALHWAMQQVGQ